MTVTWFRPLSQLASARDILAVRCAHEALLMTRQSSTMPKIPPVHGMHDLIGQAAEKHRTVIDIGARVAATYGCKEICTPIVEGAELFSRTLGTDTEVVKKEMFTFYGDETGQETGQRLLALRPENTAGVVRAFVTNQVAQPLPQRYFYSGPMFRKEKPQKGRYRQFHQLGVEMLGENHPNSDVEAISLAVDTLEALGVANKTELHVHSMADKASRARYSNELKSFLIPLSDRLSEESQRREGIGALLD